MKKCGNVHICEYPPANLSVLNVSTNSNCFELYGNLFLQKKAGVDFECLLVSTESLLFGFSAYGENSQQIYYFLQKHEEVPFFKKVLGGEGLTL